jgi:hypothetical protein
MRLISQSSFFYCFAIVLSLLCSGTIFADEAETNSTISAGFFFDHFKLTLEDGERTEAVGPFYYFDQREDENTIAFPPFFSNYKNDIVQSSEYDILYPLLTYEHYSDEWRWQLFQLIAFAGGRQPDDFKTHQFTLFPLYFQQRSLDTNLNYTAVVPFYGHLQNRLFRDKIFFVMFPIYGQSQKKDVITDNYFYPFVHVRSGIGLHGWQVWPIVGREHKDVTSDTNGFGDVSLNPGHDSSFLFWPFWLKNNAGIGTEDPENFCASIPFFAKLRSPLRNTTSVFWPFFTWVDERGKKYHEWEGPWPFVIFARGEGKTTSRVWPIFSQSHNATQESDSYIWPLYRYKHFHSDPFDQKRTSILFYLFANVAEKNTETGAHKGWQSLWPIYFWHREFNGNERLQIFAPFEVVLPTNRGIERNWAPLWSLWRAEKNPKTNADSESLLWNLYRREAAPEHKKISLLFGLFQYERDGGNHRTRLFYLTISRTHSVAHPDAK